jgi:cold-inducible RNA-binding protein
MSVRLFIGNLSFSLLDEELREAFVEIGPVERAEVVRDRFDGRSRGFGFVEMVNDGDGERAVEALNGSELMGRPMRVEIATSRRNVSSPGATA